MITFGSHKVTLPKVTLAYHLLVAALARTKINLIPYHDKKLSLRSFPWTHLQGVFSRLRFPKALPQTSNKRSYSQLLLLVAAYRLPWYSPLILLNITCLFGLFPPACCHHMRVINRRILEHYYEESTRQE
jgi:hypothetical protein